jgi:hypothetical protein
MGGNFRAGAAAKVRTKTKDVSTPVSSTEETALDPPALNMTFPRLLQLPATNQKPQPHADKR